MADYISQLNGEQMDAALMDVALHNSEAWAVGTRNGYDVEQGDATFHNNAKYYAQVAQSAIPGTYTAAVRWDIAQGLAGEAQEQARANISAGASNRNLLDNPWWGSGEVVNQRSVTAKPSSNGAYCIDRWTWNSGADANNMSLGANGITFTRSASNIWFAQKMANPSAPVGKTITGSVMLSDGTIKSGSVVYASVGSTPTLYQDSAVQIYISSVGAFSLTIKTTQTIRAVKLELGSYSTLANDVPPDYGEEFGKCITSTADPTDSYANTGFGRSNRNLLDNPFFSVNQRGFTSSTGSNGVYTVDRWKINNGGGTGGTVSVTSQGYIQLTTGSAYVSFQQMFGGNELAGKTVTMSVNDNGTIYSHSFTVPTRGSADVTAGTFVFKTGCSCHFFVMKTSSAYGYNFQLSIGQGYSATIRAVKLELGSYSTLANDVPHDYEEELRKCMYYFQRIQQKNSYTLDVGFGEALNSTTNIRITIPTAVPMRHQASAMSAVPTGTGTMYIVGNGQLLPVTAVSGLGVTGNAVVVNVTVSTAGAYNHIYGLRFTNNSTYIDLSADL